MFNWWDTYWCEIYIEQSTYIVVHNHFIHNIENKKVSIEASTLNPMAFHPRFQHITEHIFEHLGTKSLENCREVSKSWQICIDNQNILWEKVVEKFDSNVTFQLAVKMVTQNWLLWYLKNLPNFKSIWIQGTKMAWHPSIGHVEMGIYGLLIISFRSLLKWFWSEYQRSRFQLACKVGNVSVAKLLIQKSAKFNIELNAADREGNTAFHLACIHGNSGIVKMLLQKSSEFNINLNVKCEYYERTPLYCAWSL